MHNLRIVCQLVCLGVIFSTGIARGGTWDHLLAGQTIKFIVQTTDGTLYAAGINSVFLSFDQGRSWGDITNEIFGDSILNIVYSPARGRIYACTNAGIFSSLENSGSWSWVSANIQTELTDMGCMEFEPYPLFAGTINKGLYVSTDEIHWNFVPFHLPYTDSVASISTDPFGAIYVVTRYNIGEPYGNGGIISVSRDQGNFWEGISSAHQLVGTDARHISVMAFDSSSYATSSTKGIFRHTVSDVESTNYYKRINRGLVFSQIYSSVVGDSSGALYVGTIGGGVYKTRWDKDSVWTDISGDLPTRNVTNVFIDHNNRLYACTVDSGLYRTKDPVINVVHEPVKHPNPTDFELSAAYPNPFNSEITLTARIGKPTNVRVAIYDLTGKEVAVLATGNRQPATYQFHWDAVNFASGVYICRLQAGEFTTTRKIVLAR